MSKTPVSTLQEYMAKNALGNPEYVIIAQTSGTHLPSFTYRVTCGPKTAQGTASCKKEAKHNAAREMLKLLSSNNIISPRTSLALSPPKLVSADSYYSPGTSSNIHDDIFVNSVGKLSEHCIAQKLKNPEYTVSNVSGPDHARMFTITCSIGSLSTKGTANTKKQAKHDAAQNMYQTLIKTTTSKSNQYLNMYQNQPLKRCYDEADQKANNVPVYDIKMEPLSVPIEKSSNRAKELYPKLCYRDSVKIVKNIEVKDYHEALKRSVDTSTLERARKLQSGPRNNKEVILMHVLHLLNLKLECATAIKCYNDCVVRCTVNSTPVITDLGFGRTVDEAREQAIDKLLNSINLLLK